MIEAENHIFISFVLQICKLNRINITANKRVQQGKKKRHRQVHDSLVKLQAK